VWAPPLSKGHVGRAASCKASRPRSDGAAACPRRRRLHPGTTTNNPRNCPATPPRAGPPTARSHGGGRSGRGWQQPPTRNDYTRWAPTKRLCHSTRSPYPTHDNGDRYGRTQTAAKDCGSKTLTTLSLAAQGRPPSPSGRGRGRVRSAPWRRQLALPGGGAGGAEEEELGGDDDAAETTTRRRRRRGGDDDAAETTTRRRRRRGGDDDAAARRSFILCRRRTALCLPALARAGRGGFCQVFTLLHPTSSCVPPGAPDCRASRRPQRRGAVRGVNP
jgi:hypothetical protein